MIRGAVLQRDLVIVSCAISAGIHAALAPAHLEEGAGAAAAFAVSAVLLAGLCIALTRRVSTLALTGSAILLTALLAGWALAVTTGLPVVHPGPEPVDTLAVVTKAVELLGLVAAFGLLRHRFVATTRQVRPIPVALTTLIASFSALTALALTNGHHVHADQARPHAESSP